MAETPAPQRHPFGEDGTPPDPVPNLRLIRRLAAIGVLCCLAWIIRLNYARFRTVPSYQRIVSLMDRPATARASEPRQDASAAEPATGQPTTDGSQATTPTAAASAASPAAIASAAPAPPASGEYTPISFDVLSSYPYEIPDSDAIARGLLKDQIPASIKALNNQRVTVQGFMLPTLGTKGTVSHFVLLANQMGCCFGVTPSMNGWIYVAMKEGKRTNSVPDVPVTVYGTLQVGEDIKDNTLMSVYRIDADKVDVPKEGRDYWVFQ